MPSSGRCRNRRARRARAARWRAGMRRAGRSCGLSSVFRAMMVTGTDLARNHRWRPHSTTSSVPTVLQTVTAVAGFLDRAAAHCAQTGADPDDFVRRRACSQTWRRSTSRSKPPGHHAVWGDGGPEDPVRSPRPPWSGRSPSRRCGRSSPRARRRWRRSIATRSTAARARSSISRSARGGSPSWRRPSSSRSRCPTSISTQSPPTTSCRSRGRAHRQ